MVLLSTPLWSLTFTTVSGLRREELAQVITVDLCSPAFSSEMHQPGFGLFVSNAHVVFKGGLVLNQMELPDQFYKVITTESLSVLLHAFVFVNLEDLDFVIAEF